MKITVIDYGLSNLLSVRRAFEYFGAEVEVTGCLLYTSDAADEL